MSIEKALRLLEYDEIKTRLARCSVSEEAASILLSETPLTDAAVVAEMKALVSEALDRIASGDEEPRGSLPSIGPVLPKLGVEGISLDSDEAYGLGIFVSRGEAFAKWLSSEKNNSGGQEFFGEKGSSGREKTSAPGRLQQLTAALPGCSAVSKEVFRVLDKDGKLRDLPEFRAIKKRIAELTAELESAVSRYAQNEDSRRMLQSALPSQRDGRMVLAVKANYRGRIKGIVHEVSSTGQTVFVEPEEVVERNNDILIEKRRLDAEIRRILREMTGRIAEYHEPLTQFHGGILRLECIRAKARYSRETRGHFAGGGLPFKDDLSSHDLLFPRESGELVLKQARHPLLGSKAVPIDFSMDSVTRTVIITGPNTGGKTVALKTLGLFALMNQTALALPAEEGTILPIFDGVYADIGDEQSISQSLSTFSAHMTNMAQIITEATERSLVLLDELGSGTDPEEGSAIAMAILDHLIEKKARLIATTHHGILKNYGYTREGVENASVEFDGKTLSPTFRIIMGIPGESRAVDIAGRNGLPPQIIEKARSYLADERSDVSSLISSLKEKHRELDDASRSAQAEETRLREERRRSDLRELRLRQKEAELKAGAAGNLRGLLAESRKTLENLVREVREGELTREKTLKVKEFLSSLEQTVAAEDAALLEEERCLADEQRQTEKGASTSPLAPGTEVFAGANKKRGKIIRLDRKAAPGSGGEGSCEGPSSRDGGVNTWLVEIGSLKMSFPETDLIPAPPSKPANHPAKNAASAWDADLAAGNPAQFEISLRGMRLDEALDSLRRQIDAAVLAGLKTFSVVHGKGDGILQKGVHEYLKHEKAVADYYFSRPELGGFGRTEVVLR